MYTYLPKDLIDSNVLGEYSFYSFETSRVAFIHANANGWAARITAKVEGQVGCTIWGGDTTGRGRAYVFDDEIMNHLRCDHAFIVTERYPSSIGYGGNTSFSYCETVEDLVKRLGKK